MKPARHQEVKMSINHQRKKTSKAFPLAKVQLAMDRGSSNSPLLYKSWHKGFGAHSEMDNVKYQTAQ